MAAAKQQEDVWDDPTRISMPPPAYSHHHPSFSSPPPPCYYHHNDSAKVNSSPENEEDSWSVIMQRPFYQRWVYLFRSWGQVLEQGKWVFCAFIFPLLLFIIILIVYVLPST